MQQTWRGLAALSVVGLLMAAAPVGFEPVVFDEVAAERGLRFIANSGRTARKHQPETMVAGVALFDYDDDGWLDVYLVNGAPIGSLA